MLNMSSFQKNISPWFWGYFFQGAVILGIAPIMIPLIVAHAVTSQQLGNFEAGLVVAAFYLGQCPAPWFGKLAENTGRFSWVYLSGYFFIGLGCVFFPYTHMLWVWLLLAFLQGLGAGASNTLTAMYIVEFRPKSEWDKGIGWLQTIYGTGQALGLLLVACLQAHPIIAMLIAAGMMIPGFIFGRRHLPKNPKAAHINTHPNKNHPELPHHFRHHGLHPFSMMRHYQSFWHHKTSVLLKAVCSSFGLYMLSWFCAMFGMWMVINLLPLFFQNNFHISAAQSSFYYGLFAVFGIFLYAPSGNWGKKYGTSRVLCLGYCMLILSLIGMALLLVLQAKTSYFWLAPLVFCLIPIGWSPLIVAGTALAGEITSIGQGSGLGLFNANTAIASVLSAVAAGKLAESYGYHSVAYIAAIMGIVGFLLYLPVLLKASKKEAATLQN